MSAQQPFNAKYTKNREEIIDALEQLGQESGELEAATVLEALGIELGEGVPVPTETIQPEELAAAAQQIREGQIGEGLVPGFWPWILSIPWIFLQAESEGPAAS